MRFLVLSDLHSNLEALEAVLAYGTGIGFDRVLVLGDLVGYGPDPNPVLDRLRSLPGLLVIRGNHDRVAAGLTEPSGFNDAARSASMWTRGALRAEAVAYLAALPEGPVGFAPGCLLAHGSPVDEDLYLLDGGEARRCFESLPFDLCLFGHTHYPSLFWEQGGEVGAVLLRGDRVEVPLPPGRRHLLNPGSVGQPRDRNPRSSFAVYDDVGRTFTVHRVVYPLEVTRRKILAAGLPPSLGDRLRLGA
jgi:predicted phosphodiesterase